MNLKYFLRFRFFLTSLWGGCSLIYGNSQPDFTRKQLKKISFSRVQKKQLDSDQPFHKISPFDQNYSVFWLHGSHHLWLWSGENNHLKKYRVLPSLGQNRILVSEISKNHALIVTRTHVFHLNISTQNLTNQRLPDLGVIISITKNKNRFYLLMSQGLAVFDPSTGRKMLYNYRKKIKKTKNFIIINQSQDIWFVQENALKKWRFISGKAEDIFHVPTLLNRIQKVQDNIFVFTPRTILRVSKTGVLLQSIPVIDKKKLTSVAFTKEKHAYLFDDQSLEIYDLRTRQRDYVFLTEKPPFQLMGVYGRTLLLLVAGQPVMYRLL